MDRLIFAVILLSLFSFSAESFSVLPSRPTRQQPFPALSRNGHEQQQNHLIHTREHTILCAGKESYSGQETILRKLKWYLSKPKRIIRRMTRRRRSDGENSVQDTAEIPEVSTSSQSTLEAVAIEEPPSPPPKPILQETTTNVEEKKSTPVQTVEAPISGAQEREVNLAKTVEVPVSADEVLVEGRRDTAARGVDLSGEWHLTVTDEFKENYDRYLTLLGQPSFVRSIALTVVGLTTDFIEQSDSGRKLSIRGTNVKGLFERTLLSSTSENPILEEMRTIDGDHVEAESWWEDKGKVHCTWMRGYERFGGGDFENKRYLDTDKNLICETTFHPNDKDRDKPTLVWKFHRKDQ